ncbi:adenosine deaminase [Herbiconiux sp. YIM B11900]|uniref:adenosine deaminase n=1 Tax=Herbiconiux sp. YIM B11900 TaxID=3404131 RepID=UPI003F8674D8
MHDTAGLPLAELHIHIEGALEPELVFALAERNGIELPWGSVDRLRSLHEFDDVPSFLDLYYRCMDVLRTADDFRDLALAYFRRAHPDGVRHAELFFDPQAHTSRGVTIDDVLDGLTAGLEQARDELGISGGLILCILRDLPVGDALETLASVEHRIGDLLGLGLDSAELGHPPAQFAPVYQRARELGLRLVAHAGEEGPASYVSEALDVLGVERIDHGVRCLDDEVLVSRLRDEAIPLTVCPFSNVRLKVVDSLAEHPLKRMLDAGLLVTVNSDDPAYFGGYLGANLEGVADALQLSREEVRRLAANSVDASFASPQRKAELSAQIAIW